MFKQRYIAFGLISLIAITIWVIIEGDSEQPKNDTSLNDTSLIPISDRRIPPPKSTPYPEASIIMPVASITSNLHASTSSTDEDIAIIQMLLQSYRRAFDSNPIGLNDDIVASLMGRNRKGLIFLSKEHPSISESGELVDRYGTPYHFHAISGDLMEVRSAGVDLELYTSDDVLRRE